MALSGVYPSTNVSVGFETTVASLTGNSGAQSLGNVVLDNCGGQWLFVRAAEALTAYSLCHVTNASIALGTWLAEMTEAADIATGPKFLGINQVAFASGDYGWLWRGPGGGYGKGIKCRAENFAAGALAFPLSGTAGAIDDANVDEGVIAGLTTVATTTTIAAAEVMATTILTCNLGETD